MRRFGWLAAVVGLVVMAAPNAHAVHWYRNTGGGCSPADGSLTDDPAGGTPGAVVATVLMYHNSFHDTSSMLSTTTVKVGDAIRWTWNSAHCHSVQTAPVAGGFNSGFHYPTKPPESQQVVPGFFEYPVLDDTPTLDFAHTFTTPGTYRYFCIHHEAIGMIGEVRVT